MSGNPNPFDILMETEEGLYLLMASSQNRQYASIVAEALYVTSKDETRPGRSKAVAVIVRDMENPHEPIVMDVWPERWRDHDRWQVAIDRYRKQFGG